MATTLPNSILTDEDCKLLDGAKLRFGSGSVAGGTDNGDISFAWDGTDFDILQTTANSSFKWGVDGAGIDQVWYGDTAGSNMTWDQSADSLILTDDTYLVFGDSSDAWIHFNATNLVITPAAAGGTVDVGDAADTTGNVVRVFDGGADKPGAIALVAAGGGATYYLWVDATGLVRVHNAYPTDEDADGTVVGAQTAP